MATKPSPSWPPFRPRNSGSTVELLPIVFFFRRKFQRAALPFPGRGHRPSRAKPELPLLVDGAPHLVQRRPEFPRLSAACDRNLLAIARYFGKKRFSRRRSIARANRSIDRQPISTVNGRARFGNRAGSYLSCQLRVRCARHRCNYFAARSVNTPATDSRSIRGVNLSKALASARHSEYHLNALSVAAYTRLRSRVNADVEESDVVGDGGARRAAPTWSRAANADRRSIVRFSRTNDEIVETRDGSTYGAGEGVVFFHGQRRPTFFGRKTIGSAPGRGSRDESVGDIDWRATGAARSVGPSVVSLRVARMFLGRWIGGRALMHIQRHSRLLRRRRERTTPAFPTHPLGTPIRRSRERDGTKTRR